MKSNGTPSISAAIPLYNKEREIERAVRSILAQTFQPLEIIVIDDGSTDRSAEIVRGLESPLVRLISQPNAGVAAARNRASAAAVGEYIAFLDGDDEWRPGYLEKMAELIGRYPSCGAYGAAFDIVSGNRVFPNCSPATEGIRDDFFREAMTHYILQPSATVIPRRVMECTGGFPEGMKMGEDLFLWIKIASEYPVCFTPDRLVLYSRTASNRSAGIYTPEKTDFTFESLYRPEEGGSFRNEYIARCAIGKAIVLTSKGDTAFGRRAEEFFSYTRMYRRGWRRLRLLNRLPAPLRNPLNNLWNKLAWAFARKGL